ncbi:hypothetical protein LSUB1_G006150 [Lachnellula subtilissima]|uniref:Uncharacterized protein n=1 Tax=Lachnellula subtilissima TaxID=602034 RepID=A0A8H8RFX9_9HELO|nr:hypothetical protein LSUB1_G006150 [Lachnellula subtilissima]
MSEFHDAVSSLLEALEKGLSIIKAQKKRRPKDQASSKTTPEAQLNRSLKKNHTEVKKTYSRDLARFGAGFAAGDGSRSPFIDIQDSYSAEHWFFVYH